MTILRTMVFEELEALGLITAEMLSFYPGVNSIIINPLNRRMRTRMSGG